MNDIDKATVDVVAAGLTLGAVAGMIPWITAIATLLWVIFRLFELQVTKALLWKFFKWDVDEWFISNKGKKNGDPHTR